MSRGAEQSAPGRSPAGGGGGGPWALTSSHIADAPFPGERCSDKESRAEFKAVDILDCFPVAEFKITALLLLLLYFANVCCS